MLLPDNIHPEQSIYYNAVFVIKNLHESKAADLFKLYEKVTSNLEMSMPVFLLCLDWLFLVNLVDIDNKGRIISCS